VEQPTALTLNSNWVSCGDQPIGNMAGGALTTAGAYGWCYPWYYSPVYVTQPSRPIRLTMAEVDKLRRAAKLDAGLADILQKFTDQIEVVVDFGKKV
jgi:hypothetical protein